MRIWFRDYSDTGPPRVAEHRDSHASESEYRAQQIICNHGGTHCRSIVAKFTNFSRSLVDEQQRVSLCSHRTAREQCVVGTLLNARCKIFRSWINSISPNKNTDASRVTTTYFESVDCGEGLLNT